MSWKARPTDWLSWGRCPQTPEVYRFLSAGMGDQKRGDARCVPRCLSGRWVGRSGCSSALPYPVRPGKLSMEDSWRCIYQIAANGKVVKLAFVSKTSHSRNACTTRLNRQSDKILRLNYSSLYMARPLSSLG
jgi:hypothetical protein